MTRDQVTTVRLARDTLALLDRMASKLEIERATLLRRAVNRGARAVLLDEALSMYLRGELSGGAASEWAGVSPLEFLDELRARRLPFLADSEGIADEFREFAAPRKSSERRHH